MTVVIAVLVGLSGLSLGLRTTSVLISRLHPVVRLLASAVVGGIFVAVTLQISDSYRVYDLGLGLLISLAPVGIFDLLKWWFRSRMSNA